ncbi:unnamed protein product, partial [Polarella glacialis]
ASFRGPLLQRQVVSGQGPCTQVLRSPSSSSSTRGRASQDALMAAAAFAGHWKASDAEALANSGPARQGGPLLRAVWFVPLFVQRGLRAISARRHARQRRQMFSTQPGSGGGDRGLERLPAGGAPASRPFSGRQVRQVRWRALIVASVMGLLGLRRAPAWANGAMGAGTVHAVTGTLAHRVALYTGVCGSLVADLTLAAGFFFMFAICAGTETAITTLWPWKVREFAQREREEAEAKEKEALKEAANQRGGRDISDSEIAAARKIKRSSTPVGKWTALREDIQRFMQTILIGATLSGVISTAFITEICGQLFGPRGLVMATVAVSLVQLTLCEI